MILATRYTIKGIKKGHKKYKDHKAEKEQKMLEERGQLPDLQDPSRELDLSCLAEGEKPRSDSTSSIDRTSSIGSDSTITAEQSLEHDPAFKEYMDRQKQIYLEMHRDQLKQPPSYDAAIDKPVKAELPAPILEANPMTSSNSEEVVEADSAPVVFELPGNLPAIMPDSRPRPKVAELPAQSAT